MEMSVEHSRCGAGIIFCASADRSPLFLLIPAPHKLIWEFIQQAPLKNKHNYAHTSKNAPLWGDESYRRLPINTPAKYSFQSNKNDGRTTDSSTFFFCKWG